MAVTITRTNWIDDDGSGTTGTVLNNAMKTGLYNEIDTALAKVAQLAGGNSFTGNQTISGTVTVVGGVTMIAGVPGSLVYSATNTQAGPTAWTGCIFGNDVNGAIMVIGNYSSGYTSAAYNQTNGSTIYTTGPGGFSLAVTNSAPLRFYTNSLERVRIAADGTVSINSTGIPYVTKLGILSDLPSSNGLAIQNSSASFGN